MDPATLALLMGGSAIGSSLIGGLFGSSAADTAAAAQDRAAQLQNQATMAALAQQQRMYDQSRADMAPFLGMQQQAWRGYSDLINNPDFAGLNALGSLEHGNTGAYFAKGGQYNSAAHYAAQELVGQQLAMQKAQMRLSAYNPLLNLGAPSQQAALAAEFGRSGAGTLMQGAGAQGGYLAGAGADRAQGTMAWGQSLANGVGALGALAPYAFYQPPTTPLAPPTGSWGGSGSMASSMLGRMGY